MTLTNNLDDLLFRLIITLIVIFTALALYKDYHLAALSPSTTILFVSLFMAWDFGNFDLKRTNSHPFTTVAGGVILSAAIITVIIHVVEGTNGVQRLILPSWLPIFPVPFLIIPFTIGFGGIMLLWGIKGLLQFRIALFYLLLPSITYLYPMIDNRLSIDSLAILGEKTASMSGYLLWYFGIEHEVRATTISLPGGSVHVSGTCAGYETMSTMLVLSICTIAYSTTYGSRKHLLPLIAVIIGFFTNSIRVAILGILSASGAKEAFDFFHEGNGQQVFILLGVILFFGFYYLLRETTHKATTHK